MDPSHRYDDILHLPHHVSATRPRMSRLNRAAQFAPFDALSGYSAALAEAARFTEPATELDESAKVRLDRKLRRLLAHRAEGPLLTVTYFQPDDRKAGGTYRTVAGALEALDPGRGLLILEGGVRIRFEQIRRLESSLFQDLA